MRTMERKKLNEEFAKQLRILCTSVGSVNELADQIGVDRGTVYRHIKDPEKVTVRELRELNALAQKEGLNYTFT